MSAVGGFPPVSTIDLPYEGPSARDARRWARCVLAGRVDDETIEAVVVCFSELVTNSQVHTRPSLDRKEITCRLRITTAGIAGIRGEVIDAGSPGKVSTSRQVNAEDEAGRGLSQVVNGYADAWGYEQSSLHEGMTWFSVLHGTGRDRARQEMPAEEHRPRISRPYPPPAIGHSEVFEHACTPDCVPAHEHPGLGCRGLTEEIRRRRVSGEPAVRRHRRG